jgi:hypothetical protein
LQGFGGNGAITVAAQQFVELSARVGKTPAAKRLGSAAITCSYALLSARTSLPLQPPANVRVINRAKERDGGLRPSLA